MAHHTNRLGRAAERRAKPNSLVRDSEPTRDQQLARLEEDLRRVKIEFDIYFNGGTKRPPYDTKGRIDTMMKRLGDDRSMSYAQRFLYNSLVARYTALREIWRRTMKGREDSREVQMQQRLHARDNPPSKAVEHAAFVCADAQKDVQTVKGIFAALMEAKKSCNEPVDDMQFPRFHHMIATRTESLKQHLNCDRVKFSIVIQDGKVNFRAKADSD